VNIVNRSVAIAVLLFLVAASSFAQVGPSVTRDQVMASAQSYAYYQWTMRPANVRSACSNPTWTRTFFAPNTTQQGVAYCWGGNDTISSFADGIARGGAAGNTCTNTEGNPYFRAGSYGVDCSGFVGRAWQLPRKSELLNVTTSVRNGFTGLKRGDIFLLGNSHTAMFSAFNGLSGVQVIEAVAGHWKVSIDTTPLSYFSNNGYIARRYLGLQDGGTGKIDQGLMLTTRPRFAQNFGVTFRLHETDGSAIRYDDVAVAIYDQYGRYQFDLSHSGSVYLSGDGATMVGAYGTASMWPGTYVAVAYGRVGNVWSAFSSTGGGMNGLHFTVSWF
jgi:cell wall-associated NlpC family hydrolase